MDEDEQTTAGAGVGGHRDPGAPVPGPQGEAGPPARSGPGGGVGGDLGMATAEYAVATLAAVGFAGLLFAVLRSGEVQELLLELVRRALSTV
ncbi:DUF4244 domain-containing protein [Aquipuribacter sp. MA13-6]|uniref:DUF4244 domain-containing protein n=1 Tax=unclassified Aquipuribacter TaxID=2635084 RepID=UPI003EE9425D